MSSKQFREDAVPRPLEMAAVVLCVIIFVFYLPVQGGHDLAARALCFALGAGSLAIFNDYRRRARARRMAILSATLTPRCGVPLAVGGFCNEPATPGCCYCDQHAAWGPLRQGAWNNP